MTRPRAAIYTRISRDGHDDRSEDGLGVKRQEVACRALAERHQFDVVEVFEDNDVSASTNSKKPRPRYDEMIRRADAGDFAVIIAASNDRLTRRMTELVPFVAWIADRKLRFITVDGDDTSTANGEMTLHIKGSVAQQEAKRISERLTAKWEQDAEAGKPRPGRHRLFGYARDWTIIDAEAEVIRDIATRRANGQSPTSVARMLNEKGITTSSGSRWTSSTLTRLIENPALVGKRRFKGVVVGNSTVPRILEEALWLAANSEAVRGQPGTNARRWLMSGILRCSLCGQGMIGNGSRSSYRCNRAWTGCGRLTINTAHVDDVMISLVLAREAARATAWPTHSPLDDHQAEVDRCEAEIVALREAFKVGDLDREDLVALTRVMRDKQRESRAQITEVVASQITGPIVAMSEWIDLDLSSRRALVGRQVSAVIVGGRTPLSVAGRFDPSRLLVRWQDGTEQRITQEYLDSIPMRSEARQTWSPPANGTSMHLVNGPLLANYRRN